MFSGNDQVYAHNEAMIDKFCTDIRTFYALDKYDREIKAGGIKYRKNSKITLRLAKNASVMITKTYVSDGLANGVRGRIVL